MSPALLDFSPTALGDKKLMLFGSSMFVVICYENNKKTNIHIRYFAFLSHCTALILCNAVLSVLFLFFTSLISKTHSPELTSYFYRIASYSIKVLFKPLLPYCALALAYDPLVSRFISPEGIISSLVSMCHERLTSKC
jgi:hypothetical protein